MSARKKNTTKRAAKNTAQTTPAPATKPPADAPVLRTDSEKALWTALCESPGNTATGLAGIAGIAGSTARRILSGWAAAGAARRDRDPDNPRAAEHWSPTAPAEPVTPAETTSPPDTAQPDAATEPRSDTAPTATESADDTPTAPDPATGTQAPPEPAATAHTGTVTAAAAADTPIGDPDVAAAQEESPQRLAPGALRGEVEDHLRDSPGTEFTPHEIGKVLRRSSGAVHNALVKLTTLGTARQTCTRPKKFALAPGQ